MGINVFLFYSSPSVFVQVLFVYVRMKAINYFSYVFFFFMFITNDVVHLSNDEFRWFAVRFSVLKGWDSRHIA